MYEANFRDARATQLADRFALPGMGSIFLLLSLVFYVSSVAATKLFAADFPDLFGSIAASAFTLR